MPKELTHWILAQAAVDELDSDSRLRRIILNHRSAYLGGAVLPDSLLHLFRGPNAGRALQLGHRFHDAYGNSFDPLIRFEAKLASKMPDDLLACLLGVVSHMLTDIAFHPFVFALSGTRDIGQHYRLETAIDVHFLRRGAVPPVRRLLELITHESRATLLKSASMLFDPHGELPHQALEQALALHCRFQGMYNRPGWQVAARILGRLGGSPFREQRHLFYPLRASGGRYVASVGDISEWNHPVSGVLHYSSIDDLVRETLRRTATIFKSIEERGSLADALSDHPGANLLTGMPGVGKTEMERESIIVNRTKKGATP